MLTEIRNSEVARDG